MQTLFEIVIFSRPISLCSVEELAQVYVPDVACSRGMWRGPRRTPRRATGSGGLTRLAEPAPIARSEARTGVNMNY